THRKICRFVKDLRLDSLGRYTQHSSNTATFSPKGSVYIVGSELYRIVDSTTRCRWIPMNDSIAACR
ncbi:unnamed protein product, partial [Callosobruchus maculatus]